MSPVVLLRVACLRWALAHSTPVFVFSRPADAVDVSRAVAADSSSSGHKAAGALRSLLAAVSRHGAAAPAPRPQWELRSSPQTKEANGSKQHFLAAAHLFDSASSQRGARAEQGAKSSLVSALRKPAQIGRPLRPPGQPQEASGWQQCEPDLAACPESWEKRGGLCQAGAAYAGRCSGAVEYFAMHEDQKFAFARFCGARFRCQVGCDLNFDAPCPSLWSEERANLCVAPPEYQGPCNGRLETARMTPEEKYDFGARCGARWPCAQPPPVMFDDICPAGWSLQHGDLCTAPLNYTGPCPRFAHLGGMTVAEQKAFQVACNVSWPEGMVPCDRDYGAACPFGWLAETTGSVVECRAPPGYHGCARAQEFARMSPHQKRSWASSCQQDFPCRSRSRCEPDWSHPCPAGWYAFSGGASCMAPATYSGDCSAVLHGVIALGMSEKEALAQRCQLQWPCRGEAGEGARPSRKLGPGGALALADIDSAGPHPGHGPVDSNSGLVLGGARVF